VQWYLSAVISILNRLEREIDRLNDALDQLRKVKKIDEQTIIDEWKEKIQSQRNDHIDEIERIKTMHRYMNTNTVL
jgi:conjugal transfer/entry exclusion protein